VQLLDSRLVLTAETVRSAGPRLRRIDPAFAVHLIQVLRLRVIGVPTRRNQSARPATVLRDGAISPKSCLRSRNSAAP
jgi:hypothetical protein